MPQPLDDAFPRLAAALGMRLEGARGGGADETFDWVTFPIRLPAGATGRVGGRGGDGRSGHRRDGGGGGDSGGSRGGGAVVAGWGGSAPRFPRELWRTSRGWAADWLLYASALNASGVELVPAEWWRTKPRARRQRRNVSNPALELTDARLDAAAVRRLGLTPGFCAVTSPHPVQTSLTRICRREGKGSVPLPSLMEPTGEERPYTWGAILETCAAFCRQCARCNFITVSSEMDDCSWYTACPSTSTTVPGFYSKKVVARTRAAR